MSDLGPVRRILEIPEPVREPLAEPLAEPSAEPAPAVERPDREPELVPA